MPTSIEGGGPHRPLPDLFPAFAHAVGANARARMPQGGPVFLVSPKESLWSAYLDGFEGDARRQHDCHACRSFFKRYSRLAVIDADGRVSSPLWEGLAYLPEPYQAIAERLARAVRAGRIVGVFLSTEEMWGIPTAGGFHHFAVGSPGVFTETARTVSAAAAEVNAPKSGARAMLSRILSDFPEEAVRKAVSLLKGGQLFRGEKALPAAEWLLALRERIDATRDGRLRDGILWHAAATAPPGFTHVRSGVLGQLLGDVRDGRSFESTARRFGEMMDPREYRRPKAPPSEGNIEQAERLVDRLGVAPALARRFARLEDIEALWRRRDPAPPTERVHGTGGVFGHLRGAAAGSSEPVETGAPPKAMTWAKFRAEVLPTAERIEVRVPHGPATFFAFVTAADPAAPPILQWDRPDRRNPVSWYVYTTDKNALVPERGQFPVAWGLVGGAWAPVAAVALAPPMWDAERPIPHAGEMAAFVIEGARDRIHRQGGGFFVESLKAEYHGVRRTLEAHIKTALIAGRDEATACGLTLFKSGKSGWGTTFRVASGGVWSSYILDRWD